MIHRFHVHIVLALCISLHLARSQAVGEGLPIKIPSSKEAISFQEDILPILAANCTACHNQKIREGGLSLDSAYELRKGGDSGVSVVAGKPSESMLFLRASHREEDFMPPPDNTVGAQTLTPIQLGMLEQWIVSGAKASDVTYNPISWKPLPRGSGGVLAVAMSQDEHLTATARGGRVSLFDTYTGHQLATLIDSSLQKLATDIAHADLITSLAFSPMKNMIATGSFRTIKFWQRSNLSPLHDFPNTEHAYLLGYLPTSNTIVLSLADGRCAKINPSEMAPKPTMHIFGESGSQIVCATISPDGSHLYGIRSGKTILTWRLVDGQLISQFERPHNVTSITITHDGSHLVTAESDNVLRVWKTPALDSKNGNNTLALLREIPGASAPCIDLTTVPSHPGHLLGGCGDGKIRLWTIEQASMVREFAHGGAVTHLAVSPDGTRIASVGTEPGVKLWNLDDGTMIAHANGDFRIAQQLARHDASIRILKQDVVFAKSEVQQAETAKSTAADALKKASEKQKAAQSALKDKQDAHKKAKAAQKETAAALAKLTMFVESLTKSIEQATQTAEMLNNAVASTTVAAETVRKQVAEYPDAAEADKAYQSSLQATKMAQSTAVQSMTQIKKLLEESQAKHSELTKQLSDKEKTVTNAEEDSKKADRAVKNSNRDVEFAATEVQRAQETLPLRQGELKHIEQQLTVAEKTRTTIDSQYKISAQPCMAVTFSADGTLLFACDASGLLTVYGGQDGKPRRTCTIPKHTSSILSLSQDRFAVGGEKNCALYTHKENWMLVHTIGGENTPPVTDDDPSGPPVDAVLSLAFSPDGTHIASGSGHASRSGEIKFWNVADASLTRCLVHPHSDTVVSLAFSRSGKLLASGSTDRLAKIHDVTDGTTERTFEGHTGHVLGVAWQAHGRRLVTGGADTVVKVWDIQTGEQQRTIKGPSREVTNVGFIGEGDEFVATSGDATVRIFNVANGASVRQLASPGDFVQSLAISGKTVTAGSQDGKIRIWNSAATAPLHTIEPSPNQ